MKFILEENNRGITDDKLLEDLKNKAQQLNKNTITIEEYARNNGIVHPCTITRRFGSWTKALKLAGLQPSRSKIGITEEELLNNLKNVWINLGRQPRYAEMQVPLSLYSAGTYENRFGSWRQALEAFVLWINSDQPGLNNQEDNSNDVNETSISDAPVFKHKTRREISERQRFRILCRDGFRCKTCGASPIDQQGKVLLHVDHIIPWSKGGETIDENLETKCKDCNFGKGNNFNV